MKKVISLIFVAWVYASCTDDNTSSAPKSVLNGEVVSVTATPLTGVTIDIYQDDLTTPKETMRTDDNGKFSLSLEQGTYQIHVVADGYQVYEQTVTVEDTTKTLSISLHGQAVIKGRIIDSQTGTGLAGARLIFFRDNRPSGRVTETGVRGYDLSIITDDNGLFNISDAPTGKFVAEVARAGFFIRTLEKLSFADGLNEIKDVTLVDRPDQGAMRIVLIWGETPSDLDSHLTGPDGVNRFHMYWDNKKPTAYASLDVDDKESYGPETTTLTNPMSGLYRFSVHNYVNGLYEPLGASQIAASPAVVEVYDAQTMLHSFTASPFTGEATTWRVFELSVAGASFTVSPINTYIDNTLSDEVIDNFRDKGDKNAMYNIDDF